MAVARTQGQGGASANNIWLIVFVALWLASTVFLVIIYMDKEERDTKTARAESSLAQAQSKVNDLKTEKSELAKIATGDSEKDLPGARSEFNARLENIRGNDNVEDPSIFEGVSYAEALDNMYDLFITKAEALASAEKGIADRTIEFESLRNAQAQQKADFEKQTEELNAKIAKIEAERDQYRRDRDGEIDGFEEQIEAIKQQCSDDIQSQRGENARLRDDYEELLTRYQELKSKLGQSQVSPIKLATAREGDGRILKAVPGDDVVFIDLGAKDHLTLGLEFAVYDSLSGIPEDGKSKARIEIVRIHEDSAECRIVQSTGTELVLAGDIVANPVYDRNRTLKFYVMGDFDLDGDGRGDRDGRQRVESLVLDWGGKLETELSARVDFVVLGGPPSRPHRANDLAAEDDVNYQSAKRAYDTYTSHLSTVEVLAIPTLTQSVFLNFLGYSESVPAVFGVVEVVP